MSLSEYMLLAGLLCMAPVAVLGSVVVWLLSRIRRDTDRLDTERIRRK